MSEATLRSRRAYIAPGDDDPTDSSRPVEILDHSEQTKVVSELVEQARRSARHYRAAAIALTAVVALLLSISRLPTEAVPAFLSRLAFLSLLVFLCRQIYALRASTALVLHLDGFLALPTLLVAFLAYRAHSVVAEKRLLWTLAPVGAQVITLLLDWEARRIVVDAEGLRDLMYDAPEA